MNRRYKISSISSLAVCLIYLLALAVTTALLVFWVLVVQRFTPEINQLISRFVVEWNYFHWFIQTSGVGLFFLVILALTWLLAVTLSERRYSRKQEEFLSNITHELKTPLAAIKLHAQTLLQDDVSAADRQRFVRFIDHEAEQIRLMVDNLLESSRRLAGLGETQLEPINLHEFFDRYQSSVAARFDLRMIELQFEIRTRAVVMATTEALQRIMDNLIDNAVRFTGKGGKIHCLVHDGGDNTEIVVADTGIGIPRSDLTKIFDRFYRLRRDIDDRRRSTGLGLAIVRSLVEELRGSIRAVSREGEPGTRFEIQLPQTGDRLPELTRLGLTRPGLARPGLARPGLTHPEGKS